MKVSELSGALHDYWVAKADGSRGAAYSFQDGRGRATDCGVLIFYSSDWRQGGPILEREGIHVRPLAQLRTFLAGEPCWQAMLLHGESVSVGRTILEAAMRCFVVSKFGREVPDEVQT